MSDVSWAGIGAAIGAVVTGLFAWLTQRTKKEGDTEIAVIAEWAKLVASLSDRLSAVEKEFSDYRNAAAQEMDEMRKAHRAEMRAMRDLNDGLQRAIAQNSQSAAQLLGASPVSHPRNDDA